MPDNFEEADLRWQDQTFARFLMLRGGAASPEEVARADQLMTTFLEVWPEAALRWQEWNKAAIFD